ncbi:MAG: hypothetical protein PVG07_05680 [Acidobacteriota bacterium]|jgi:hypothetical protein
MKPKKRTEAVRRAGQVRIWLVCFLFVAALIPNSKFLIPHCEAAAGAASFVFPSLNGKYSMDGTQLEPIRQGALTIHLSSPSNLLIIRGHALELEPLPDGSYRSRVTVDFQGKGALVARFETSNGTTSSPMEDELVVPRQTLDLKGRVRFHRVPEGWEVTALELPRIARVDIRSRLAISLVTTCEQLAAFLGLDCGGLDRSLSRVEVPLPEPGTVFFLEEADLTPEEVRRLDGFLGTGIP